MRRGAWSHDRSGQESNAEVPRCAPAWTALVVAGSLEPARREGASSRDGRSLLTRDVVPHLTVEEPDGDAPLGAWVNQSSVMSQDHERELLVRSLSRELDNGGIGWTV